MEQETMSYDLSRIVNVDLDIHAKANEAVWDRYQALIYQYSLYLFRNEIGEWGGKETPLPKFNKGFTQTNYWFVLEEGANQATEKLKRMILNFKLKSWVRMSVSEAADTEIDYRKEFQEKEKLEITWTKE